ncbi:MAG: ferric reductase-like transmembrane domain-containing protein [Solirubrobacteraceae bacterium]|jgi:predicted ferric reductase
MTLWYISRATGVVALVLLTITVALGVANAKRLHTRRVPRFVVNGIHRNASLLAVSFVLAHVTSVVADGYVPIHIVDVFVPFLSAYKPLWVGVGAVAFDLLLAVILTSLLRRRIGNRAWRATHWLAYACWPVALLHGLEIGTDSGSGWMLAITAVCVVTVLVAVAVRLRQPPSTTSSGKLPKSRAGSYVDDRLGQIVIETRRADSPASACEARS